MPSDISSVLVVASNGIPAREPGRRTLTGGAARRLAILIDGLRRDNRGVHGCTLDTGFRITMTFVTDHGTLVFTENRSCGDVAATLDGRPQPVLFDTAVLRRTLRQDLGLPSTG